MAENFPKSTKRLNTELPYDPAIVLLRTYISKRIATQKVIHKCLLPSSYNIKSRNTPNVIH